LEPIDPIVCPRCRRPLGAVNALGQDEEKTCSGCGSRYRSLRGILDLRVRDDVFLSNEADWEFALKLNDVYEQVDFEGLLQRYFALSPEIPADLRARQAAHIQEGPARFMEHVASSSELQHLVRGRNLLDLGCGTGSVLLTLARHLPTAEPPASAIGESSLPGKMIGLDIAMRWLLLARKRLDELGLTSVQLVCGGAEAQPFISGVFDGVIGGDVIEHVEDQLQTFHELHRVLKASGRLFLATPNRYSLAPEPHVQVWGVGFLPRVWMPAYVKFVRQVDFRAIRTLGCCEWARLLRRTPFGGGTVLAPPLGERELGTFGPLKRRLGRLYNQAAGGGRLGRWLALRFGPFFHLHCQRQA